MARLTFTGAEEFADKIAALAAGAESMAKAALYEGASVAADALKTSTRMLPTDTSEKRPFNGVPLNAISPGDLEDLINGIGIARFEQKGDEVTTSVSFNGYTRRTEKDFPNGVPLAMIARTIESGNSIRLKHPFVRQTANAVKAAVLAAMTAKVDETINKQMANIGLSMPYYAKYNNANGTITYSGLKVLGKAIQVDVTTEGKDPEKLYANNGPVESVALFGGGTVTLGIDELALDVAADVLGMTAPTTSAPGITFEADKMAPYVGLGFIVKKVHESVVKWRTVVLYKCQFKTPDFSISTQGETVEFQTPELEAEILRDDAAAPKWAHMQDYETEAAALSALQTALGGT